MPSVFLQIAQKVIAEEKRPLSATEIWEIAEAKGYYEKGVTAKGKTPWATLAAQLYVDVRDNPQSVFAAIGAQPKKFILKALVSELGNKILEQVSAAPQQKPGYLEKDLHPFLVFYGFYYLGAHLKTIHHEKSGKKEFSEWVHPDIVGCYFPFNDWKGEVVEVSSAMGDPAIRLFSFELKRELSFSNLREAFFQAVSNSSWANEGYLVAAEINKEKEFRDELRRLSSSFGIGVIRIDIVDPDATEILFRAGKDRSVDWETVNKIAELNPDFQDFLKRVKTDISSREIRREMYDKVYDKDTLVNSLNGNK
jgi:hypothetical protein